MPKAPKLLGSLVGLAITEGAMPAGKLVELYEKVEDTETRRRGIAEALLFVKVGSRMWPVSGQRLSFFTFKEGLICGKFSLCCSFLFVYPLCEFSLWSYPCVMFALCN